MEQDKRRIKRAPVKICPVCGKTFRAVKDQNGRFGGKIRRQIYCSRECWSKRGITFYKHKCLYCGKWFKTKDIRVRKYCSRECAFKDKKGVKAGAYKDGKSLERERAREGNNLARWRNRVYKRDNYTCQLCGAKNGNGKKIYLHAHHIKSFSEFPELRFDVNNGMTLCEECHGKIHNKNFANRRIKFCVECGAKITGQNGSNLCRSCAIKKSWVKRKQYTGKKAELIKK